MFIMLLLKKCANELYYKWKDNKTAVQKGLCLYDTVRKNLYHIRLNRSSVTKSTLFVIILFIRYSGGVILIAILSPSINPNQPTIK